MSQVPTVRDLMDKTFVTLHADMSVYEAIDIMMKKRITGAAVVDEEDRVVGILSEKDCLRTVLVGAYDRGVLGNVSDYMTKPVMTIPPETDLFEVTEIFLQQVYRRLLVVEDGKLVGQITRRDLLRAIEKIIKDNRFRGMHSGTSEPEHQRGLSFRPFGVKPPKDAPYKD